MTTSTYCCNQFPCGKNNCMRCVLVFDDPWFPISATKTTARSSSKSCNSGCCSCRKEKKKEEKKCDKHKCYDKCKNTCDKKDTKKKEDNKFNEKFQAMLGLNSPWCNPNACLPVGHGAAMPPVCAPQPWKPWSTQNRFSDWCGFHGCVKRSICRKFARKCYCHSCCKALKKLEKQKEDKKKKEEEEKKEKELKEKLELQKKQLQLWNNFNNLNYWQQMQMGQWCPGCYQPTYHCVCRQFV